MTRMRWWLVDAASRMLEPDEREAVRGDLAELGVTAGHALRDLLGLVVRRQAALWKDGQPWVALVGLVAPLGMVLSLVSRWWADGNAINLWLYLNWVGWAFLDSPGARLDFAHVITAFSLNSLTLIGWSWSTGFVLGSLSPRTRWVNGALFCLVLFGGTLGSTMAALNPGNSAVFSSTFYRVVFPTTLRVVLVVVPSLWGIHRGSRLGTLPLRQTIVWAATIATLTALATGSLEAADAQLAAIETHGIVTGKSTGILLKAGIWGWWHLRSGWQLRLLPLGVFWPVAYMVATASWRRWHTKGVSA